MFYIIFCLQADTHRAGFGAITATCTNPSGHVLDIMVRKTDDDKFDIPFNPHEKGRLCPLLRKTLIFVIVPVVDPAFPRRGRGYQHIFDNNFA